MKRLFCIMLTAIMLLTVCAFSASAESADKTDTSCIYFQVPNANGAKWNNFKMIYCHIWGHNQDFYAWQTKDERCTDLGNGYWSYDISGLDFSKDNSYSVIFSNEIGLQTYDLTLTSACAGDIISCDGSISVNPVDSSKKCYVARWLTNGDSVHPKVQTDSTGLTIDPDAVGSKDIDTMWGEAEGVSVEFPKVEISTEEPTLSASDDSNENTTSKTESDPLEDGEQDSTPVWVIILVIIGVAAVAVVIGLIVLKKNEK